MAKISKSRVRSFILNPHLIYLIIIVTLLWIGYNKNQEWDFQIKGEEQLQKELRQRVNILLLEIAINDDLKDLTDKSIKTKENEIKSLKTKIRRISKHNYVDVPYNERNGAIELVAGEK